MTLQVYNYINLIPHSFSWTW